MKKTCARPAGEATVPSSAHRAVRAVAQLIKVASEDLSSQAFADVAKTYGEGGKFGVECFFDIAGIPSLRFVNVTRTGERTVVAQILAKLPTD